MESHRRSSSIPATIRFRNKKRGLDIPKNALSRKSNITNHAETYEERNMNLID